MPINEGQTIQYTVTTTNTADGTVLYWKTTGNTTNSDIVGGNTGSITITNNRATFNVSILSDLTSDGIKTIGVALLTGSVNGTQVTTTASPVVVNDTSIIPATSISANVASLSESNTVLFTVTSSVPDGTILYWTNSGTTSASDFSDSLNSGSITISSGTATVSRTLSNDVATEGTETIILQVRVNSTSGTIVATSNTISVSDTSTAPPVYKLFVSGIASVGSLGLNNTIDRSSPTQVGSDTTWNTISGQAHVGAVKNNGTLWTWGYNFQGQLGNSTQDNTSSPAQIGALTNWQKAIPGYPYHMHFLKTDGTIWCVGSNNGQALGIPSLGTPNRTFSPRQLGSDTNWSNMVALNSSSFARKSTGTIWRWGQSPPSYSVISTPTQIGALTNWSNELGSVSSAAFVIKNDGTLWSWGSSGNGELGRNINYSGNESPAQVGTDTNWSKLSSNLTQSCMFAIKTDGTLWAWGSNGQGQLGTNDTINRSSPTQVGTDTNWSSIADGAAIKTNGTAWAWGRNDYGTLGLNDIANKSSPVQIGSGTNWQSVNVGQLNLFLITSS